MPAREVRIQSEHYLIPRPLVLVDSKAWVMVRRADCLGAAPFVISRKEWERMPRE